MYQPEGQAPLNQACWQRITQVTLGFLLKRNMAREDAENITSDALCTALEKYDPDYWRDQGDAAIEAEEAMRRFTVMVAEHKARAFWRQKRREKRYFQPMEEEHLNGAGLDSPDSLLERQEDSSRLEQSLQALAAKDRLMLDLWSRKWSYNQMAHHLSMTVPAVKSRLNKVRKKLKSRAMLV